MKICKNLAAVSLVFAAPGTFPWKEDNGVDIQQGSRGIISKFIGQIIKKKDKLIQLFTIQMGENKIV